MTLEFASEKRKNDDEKSRTCSFSNRVLILVTTIEAILYNFFSHAKYLTLNASVYFWDLPLIEYYYF